MSASFSGNIANYLKTGVVADRAYPGSMFCWFRWPTDDNLLDILLYYGDDDTARQNWNLGLSGGGGAARDKFQAGERNNSGNETATSSAKTVADTWYAGGGIFRGASDRSCYLNGTRADSTTTEDIGTQSNVIIGVGGLLDNSATNPFTGNIAHAAVWNVDIGDTAMTLLAAGVHPLAISPSNLIFYHPLTHNEAGDFFEPTTVTGTVPFPGLMPPVGQWDDEVEYIKAVIAAGGSTFEESVAFANSFTLTKAASLVAEGAASMGVTQGKATQAQLDAVAAGTLALQGGITHVGGANFDNSVTLSSELTSEQAGGISLEAAAALGAILGDAESPAGSVYGATATLGASASLSALGGLMVLGEVTFAADLTHEVQGGSVFEASVNLSSNLSLADSALLTAAASMTLGLSVDQPGDSDLEALAAATLAVTGSLAMAGASGTEEVSAALSASVTAAFVATILAAVTAERTITIAGDVRSLSPGAGVRSITVSADVRSLVVPQGPRST